MSERELNRVEVLSQVESGAMTSRAAAEAAAREKGYSLAQLTGNSSKKARGSSPPKYRHPETPELTWSGRGRQPAWYKKLVEAGTRESALLI